MPRTAVPSTGPLSRLRSATRKLWYPPRDLGPAVSTGEPRLVVVAPRLRRDSVATGVSRWSAHHKYRHVIVCVCTLRLGGHE